MINDVPVRNNIIPRYSHFNILEFPDIVKLYTCLFLYDHLFDANNPPILYLPLLSEQYRYTIEEFIA